MKEQPQSKKRARLCRESCFRMPCVLTGRQRSVGRGRQALQSNRGGTEREWVAGTNGGTKKDLGGRMPGQVLWCLWMLFCFDVSAVHAEACMLGRQPSVDCFFDVVVPEVPLM